MEKKNKKKKGSKVPMKRQQDDKYQVMTPYMKEGGMVKSGKKCKHQSI